MPIRKRITVFVVSLALVAGPLYPQTSEPRAPEQNRSQRNLEIAAFAAVFFAAGCGNDLLSRHEGNEAVENTYRSAGIDRDDHRRVHAATSALGWSLYVASAVKLYQLNRTRKNTESQDRIHNALFTATVGTVTATGIMGLLSAGSYRDGNSERGRSYARGMRNLGYFSLSLGFADILLMSQWLQGKRKGE